MKTRVACQTHKKKRVNFSKWFHDWSHRSVTEVNSTKFYDFFLTRKRRERATSVATPLGVTIGIPDPLWNVRFEL